MGFFWEDGIVVLGAFHAESWGVTREAAMIEAAEVCLCRVRCSFDWTARDALLKQIFRRSWRESSCRLVARARSTTWVHL